MRLASRLAGWKIDIKSEQEKKREVEAEMERMARDTREMAALEGVSEKIVQKLRESGIGSLDGILAAQVEGLTQIPGVGPKTAEKIVAAAEAGLTVRAEREEGERLQREQEEAEAAAQQAEEQARLADEAAAMEAARQEEEAAAAAAGSDAAGEAAGEDSGGNGATDQGNEDAQPFSEAPEAPNGVDEAGPSPDRREESLAPDTGAPGSGSGERRED